jgi:hypothetical protein
MAKKSDLMGLGLPVFLAQRMATEPSQVTAVGASRASATTLGGDQFLTVVVGTNSGVALQLPQIGGNGCLLGDDFIVNALAATASVYPGSGCTISVGAASYSTGTGVTVELHTATSFYPITATQWIGIKGA